MTQMLVKVDLKKIIMQWIMKLLEKKVQHTKDESK